MTDPTFAGAMGSEGGDAGSGSGRRDHVSVSEVVVVGSGIAGLSTALGLAPRRVTLLTKTELQHGGSSSWAQGGIAAAVAEGDTPADHASDTHLAGAGLCSTKAVQILTSEGPGRVHELIELGAQFDRDPKGKLVLGREGAHGQRRILHANGDATGAEMIRALVEAVHRHPRIEVHERAFAYEIVRHQGRAVGVMALHDDGHCNGGRTVFHRAAAIVLATGGAGQLYSRTTNPTAVTGDGIAMAARAGVRLADLEFVQFHPTALHVDADDGLSTPLPLVTEALRGEGAILLNEVGERFMVAEHPLAELAPRDIVARAIWHEQVGGRRVYLDARQILGKAFPERFPTVFRLCLERGIDPRVEPIPVSPAAHYFMGGVATDIYGRTSLPGLWACGEAASTGVHGANRLASNSLLEGLVYGARVAEDITRHGVHTLETLKELKLSRFASKVWPGTAVRREVRELMWKKVGLRRDNEGLRSALERLTRLERIAEVSEPAVAALERFSQLETANLLVLARLVTTAARSRQESRGAHYRADFPSSDPRLAIRRFWGWQESEGPHFSTVAPSAMELEEIA